MHNYIFCCYRCETCGKYVCVECKQNLSRRHSQSSGNSSSTHYTYHIFCPDCAVEESKKNNTPLGGIFQCIALIIFTIIANVVPPSMGFEIPIFFNIVLGIAGVISLVLIIYVAFIKGPRETKKAEEIQKNAHDAFQQTRLMNQVDKDQNIKEIKQIAVNCKFCGAPIQVGDNFCKFCGQSWNWK